MTYTCIVSDQYAGTVDRDFGVVGTDPSRLFEEHTADFRLIRIEPKPTYYLPLVGQLDLHKPANLMKSVAPDRTARGSLRDPTFPK